jgi:hypothetical protein
VTFQFEGGDKLTEEQLIQEIFNLIKKSKHKIINLNIVSDHIRGLIGDVYSSNISIAVKNKLKLHKSLDFFRSGDYIHDQKYHYCTGDWLAIKGVYNNPIAAKEKMGWYSWQESEHVDWDSE